MRLNAKVYRRYLLVLLMAVLTFNYLDRVALSVVLQTIKTDVHLTDTELGLLSGIAFAFFYAIMGIPIARWADRGNRVTIIAATTGLWSLMVVLTGRAMSFAQLLATRVGVGIGEAGCIPAANSLIPDYYPRAERARAMAIYLLGGSLSLTIGYFAAGWLDQLVGWRAMFMMIGLPGLALAVLSGLTLEEPRRARESCPQSAPSRVRPRNSSALEPTMGALGATLWGNRTFRQLAIVFSISSFFGYGQMQWIPAFFIRSYGYRTGELGTMLALTYGLSGLIGTYVGGVLASRYAPHREALQFRVMAVAFCTLSITWMGTFLSYTPQADFALLAFGILGGGLVNGPIFAAIQSLVPENMRAMAIAIVLFCSNLIGMGLGPLFAGALSDALRPEFAQQSLRFALLCLCPGYIWCGWHLWRASTTVQGDLESARQTEAQSGNTSGFQVDIRATGRLNAVSVRECSPTASTRNPQKP